MRTILYSYWPKIYFTIYRVPNLHYRTIGLSPSVVPAAARRRAKGFSIFANNRETHCFDYVCSNQSSDSKNEKDAFGVQYLNTFEMYIIIRIFRHFPQSRA